MLRRRSAYQTIQPQGPREQPTAGDAVEVSLATAEDFSRVTDVMAYLFAAAERGAYFWTSGDRPERIGYELSGDGTTLALGTDANLVKLDRLSDGHPWQIITSRLRQKTPYGGRVYDTARYPLAPGQQIRSWQEETLSSGAHTHVGGSDSELPFSPAYCANLAESLESVRIEELPMGSPDAARAVPAATGRLVLAPVAANR